MAPPVENHYATLGVSRSANGTALRAAYVAMARELHPDRHMNSTPAERARAERVMRKINEAWSVLGDPTRKATYDERLEQISPRSTPSPPRPQSSGRTSASSARPTSAGRPASSGRSESARPSDPTRGAGRHGGRASRYDEDESDLDDDTDLAEVTPGVAWLARLLPIGLLVGVLFLLLIVTAFAGGGSGSTTGGSRSNSGSGEADSVDSGTVDAGLPASLDLTEVTSAIVVDAGGVLYPQLADCAGPHDAIVAGEELSGTDCPDGTVAADFGGRALCLVFPDSAG